MEPAPRTCGSCTQCCKLMSVREIGKPPNTRCTHVGPAGCRIYETRPASCRIYNCLWLTEPGLADKFRPDLIRTVLLGFHDRDGRKAIIAICDPARPLAWRERPTIDLLRTAAAHGHPVHALAGRRSWQVLPATELEGAPLPVPAGPDMQDITS